MSWFINAFGFLCKGGPVMIPLMACSVISVAVMIERFIRLRQAGAAPDELMERIEKCLALGKGSEAVNLCRTVGTPLAEMLARGIECRGMGSRQAERCMEEYALKMTPALFNRLPILDTIITIAPLLGLLGTVTGMIRSFHVISTKSGLGTPTAITGGVAEALIATATGLAIAIATLIGYNYLTEKAKGLVSDMEVYGTRLVNILSAGEEDQHEAKALRA